MEEETEKKDEAEIKKPFAITPAYDILPRGSEEMVIGLCHLHMAKAE